LCVFMMLAGLVYSIYTLCLPEHVDPDRGSGDDGKQYDCGIDRVDWENRWSTHKKAWCCLHNHVGCPPRSTDAPYDCSTDNAHDRTEWSVSRKAWCCEFKLIGCPSLPHLAATTAAAPNAENAPPEYDCTAGALNWKDGWADDKKTWCCNHGGPGCSGGKAATTATTTTPLYDCYSGKDWSVGRKAWCCDKTGRACPKDVVEYDCVEGWEDWERNWLTKQKEWCCSHQQKGCSDIAGDEHESGIKLMTDALKQGPLGKWLR